MQESVATTAKSDRLAKYMKKSGFKFLGSTALYMHIQATGLTNDHLVDSFRYDEVSLLYKSKENQPSEEE